MQKIKKKSIEELEKELDGVLKIMDEAGQRLRELARGEEGFLLESKLRKIRDKAKGFCGG